MRSLRPLAVAAVAALALTACGDSDSGQPADDPTGTETAAGSAGAELGEGVAATVDGTEIPTTIVENRVDSAAQTPEVSELLEGEQAEAVRAQLRASVLSQLIVNELVVSGAEDLGLEVDDEAIAQSREELVESAGGEDAFDEQVVAAGLDESQLAAELESITALRLVREELADAEEAETEATATEGPQAQPTEPTGPDAALEQWLVEQLRTAEIQVDPEIGTWDPAQGLVVPPGGGLQAPSTGGAPPAPTEAPTGAATEGGTGADATDPAASPDGS